MTQEQKELLLKDLCVRLPYGVKLHAKYINVDLKELDGTLKQIDNDKICGLVSDTEDTYSYIYVSIDEIKPYLFPLSSMTEEQREEWYQYCFENENKNIGTNVDWLNKNHFDYRGLIDKDLALDATNLNIY